MQFTKAEEYGLLGLIYLAKQPRGTVASLTEISQAQSIPDKFLAKIFQSLTRGGLIKSHRGVRGGFSLNRPAKKIKLGEVLNTILGTADPLKCYVEGRECKKIGDCPVRDVIMEGRNEMFKVYNRYSIQSLADQY